MFKREKYEGSINDVKNYEIQERSNYTIYHKNSKLSDEHQTLDGTASPNDGRFRKFIEKEIESTKASIQSDIDILLQIATDKNTPPNERIKAVEASISTKLLLSRIEFDGLKVLIRLETNSKRNKKIVKDRILTY